MHGQFPIRKSEKTTHKQRGCWLISYLKSCAEPVDGFPIPNPIYAIGILSVSLQSAGNETIMMNSNPDTVSTDYGTSDQLYFEALTTSLKLALPIQQYLDKHKPVGASGAGPVHIWGTSPDSIDSAEY
ncbi:hypothetical protein Nepgr_010212 [Nepenthes gracilis]|uniref:Carbamoyl phosphate synthase preATP-grasp domain-containing protein n=1 Tax=Nepenthes gracilis TaxID=150966 RepID=A0AAD3SCZ6_NEPGR|nr:hypothetical protein Nepgr_010212 [Nepenthes gracilis]